jgi:uncharacterized protein
MQQIKLQQQTSCIPTQRLDLSSIPTSGQRIVNAMLDLTLKCNLRCSYCFKEKKNEDMPLRVAQDAIVWLIFASGQEQKIGVFFMGGEPLLRFELLKSLVPFGRERAKSHGKNITFGVTTNSTLLSAERVEFAQMNGLGFHLSLDGCPRVQDRNRPLESGAPSSTIIEQKVSLVLEKQPSVMARACLSPENVKYLLQSYRYFRNLGFVTIGFFPSEIDRWTSSSLRDYEQQLLLLGEEYIQCCRDSNRISLQPLERWFSQKNRKKRGNVPCGSGRGLVLIDVHGGIWPCSRFSSHPQEVWQLGSIYENGFQEKNRKPFLASCPEDMFYDECEDCIATPICSGGCYVENLEATGNIYKMHRNDCELNRILARVGTHVHDILYTEKNPLFMERFYPQEWSKLRKNDSHDAKLDEPCAT